MSRKRIVLLILLGVASYGVFLALKFPVVRALLPL